MPGTRRIAIAAALTAAAVSCAATPAAALPPGRSGLYGGGAVQDFLQFVSVRVLPDGLLSAHATLVTRCAPRFGDQLSESIAVRDVRLSEDGRYSATTEFANQVDPGVPIIGGLAATGTISFSTSVLARGVARGVVRVRTVYSDPTTGAEVSRCDTGRIPWTGRRPARDAGTGTHTLQPGVLRGTTTQEEPFLMTVTRRGRLVRRAGMTVQASCPSGVGVPLDVVAHRVRVRRGRFGATDEFQRPFTYPDGERVVEHYTWELRGRFGRRGARGSFQLRGVVRRESDGENIGSCDTGAIAWRASP